MTALGLDDDVMVLFLPGIQSSFNISLTQFSETGFDKEICKHSAFYPSDTREEKTGVAEIHPHSTQNA